MLSKKPRKDDIEVMMTVGEVTLPSRDELSRVGRSTIYLKVRAGSMWFVAQ